MNKEQNGALVLVLGNLVVVVLLALSFYYAWALSIMWAWFAVPLFNLPALSALHAWGLMFMLNLVRVKLDFEKKNTDGMASGWFGALLAPLVALSVGYLVKP